MLNLKLKEEHFYTHQISLFVAANDAKKGILNSQNNLIIQAGNNLTTQGSQLTAGTNANNVIMLDAKGDMNFDAVNNEPYSYYYNYQENWGRNKINSNISGNCVPTPIFQKSLSKGQ